MIRFVLTLLAAAQACLFAGFVMAATDVAAAEVDRSKPFSASASEPVASHSLSQGFDFSALGQLFAGLVLVLVLFLGLAWLVKRSGVAGGFSHQGLKVLASLPVSTRERVVLVQAGTKQLLLGVAPGRVNLLESFEQPLIEEPKGQQPPFSHWLQRAMMKSQGVAGAAEKGSNEKTAKDAGVAGD